MLSFRAIVRTAPRIASRIASHTARSSLRPAFQSTLRPAAFTQIPRCCFSTSISRLDSASQELAAKLDNEIALESEDHSTPADSDSNISAFLSENDQWSIEDREGEQDVSLTRAYEDETITVGFSIADFNSPMMQEGQEEDVDEAMMDEEEDVVDTAQSGGANTKGAVNQGRTAGGNIKVAPEDRVAPADREELRNEEDDGDGQPAFPANINVLVQKPNKGALRVNLIADNGVFTIQSVTQLPDSSSNKSASELLRDTPESLYTGPPFQQLDEEVQSLLEQYLDVRGINTALALFIPEYIDVKEQKEYLGWLRRVKEFVE